ncbi:MAG: hypothetical protein HDT32_06665 [Clostridiales bacterium]|nr:hypothetical protein [Clostridiales bacterium]
MMKNVKLEKFRIVLALSMIVIILGFAVISGNFVNAKSVDFKDGEGTAESPYIISTPEELSNVRYHRDAYFLQTANIDMSEYKNFAPIGSIDFPFTGRYDGGKYCISNLKINSTENNVGLFSYIRKGEIDNLKLKNCVIKGEYNVGSFVGINQGSLIGCIADCEVSGKGSVGGIAGLNSGLIKECANKGVVKSVDENIYGQYSGGICGINNKTIQDCYNLGKINYNEAETAYSGGITGRNGGGSASIEKSYTVSKVGGRARGEIVGDNLSDATVKNSFWQTSELNLVAAFANGNISNVKSVSKAAFSDYRTFGSWQDFDNLWMYLDGNNYPILRLEYVPVESVSFEKSNIELQPGGHYSVAATIAPVHATLQDIDYEVSGAVSEIEFDKSSRAIRVKDDATIGSKIYIKAKAENCETTQCITVVKIPAERIEIINESGIEEISATTSLKFKSIVYPEKATYRGVEYSVSSSFADITPDGVLTVKENVPIGLVIIVTAMAEDNKNIFATAKVTVKEVKTEKVEITSGNEFKVTQRLELSAEVYPSKASDKNVKYEIVSSTAKGAQIIGNSLYADGVGEVIIRAHSGGKYSEDFTVKVLKEPVTSIVFDMADNMFCGEGLVLNTKVLPNNATYKNVEYTIISSAAQAEIIDGVLYAYKEGTIIISANADGITEYHTIIVNRIRVESLELTCADSFEHTESLILNSRVLPKNATNKKVTYSIVFNTAGAYISDDVLYAERPGTVTIKAEADGVYDEKTITVLEGEVSAEKIDVQAINFTCENSFKITEDLQLSAKVFPVNATVKNISYQIISDGNTNAQLTGYRLYAEREGEIVIRATADGVSKDLTVFAMKEPVANIVFNSAREVKVYENLYLSTMVYPSNATYKKVRYELVENTIGAEIIDDSLLYCERVGTVILRVYADDIYKDYEIEITKEPVVNIVLNCASSFKHTESLVLSASVLPRNATNTAISYEIISGQDFAWIENGILYATRPGTVTLKFTADGFSKEIDIKVIKESVTDIVLDGTDEFELNKGFRYGEIELKSKVYPANATYPDVEYNIVSCGDNCVAYIDNGYLKVNLIDLAIDKDGYAKKAQSTVTVSSTADGITTYRTYIVNKEDVREITLSKKLEAIEGEIVDVEEMTFKTSGKMHITVNILSEYATCQDYEIFIDGERVELNAENIYKLSQDLPDKVKVVIQSLCDPSMKAEFEFVVEVEPVVAVYLGTEVKGGDSDTRIVKTKRGDIPVSANGKFDDVKNYSNYSYLEIQQNSEIMLRAFGNAENLDLAATYGYMKYLSLYYVVDGVEKQFTDGESNNYFSYNGEKLTIQGNAPVNKSFYIYAKDENSNVKSERTEIKIQSQYILDINSTTIDSNGLVNGLSDLYNSANNTSIIEKVAVKITHTSGITIEKTIATNDPSLRLQLYNPILGGSFSIEYTVYFNENGNRYSYVLPKVKEFGGINSSTSIQSPETSNNAIVLFDFSSGISSSNFASSYVINSKVKVLYIYSNGRSVSTNFDIDNDRGNCFDLYLNNIKLSAKTNSTCIIVRNSGDFRLITNNTVSIKGGKGLMGNTGTTYNIDEEVKDSPRSGGQGENGNDGGAGIFATGNTEIISNGTLSISGGAGGTGGYGGSGEGSDQKGTGRAGDGGAGGTGGAGGNGITVYGTLALKGSNISVIGGAGGKGGEGGLGGNDSGAALISTADSGGDGGKGGSGGNGGDGIYANYIEINCSSLDITSGAGGKGGKGGCGGDTREVYAGTKSYLGAGGSGGNGGNSGNGIVTRSNISYDCTVGAAGAGGSRGSDGFILDGNPEVRANSNTDGASGSTGQSVSRI